MIGSESKRRYRIRLAGAFNVDLLRADGSVEQRICFMPEGSLVNGDIMLAQKIALETDEPAARQIANIDWGHYSLMVGRHVTAQDIERLTRVAEWALGS